MFKSVKRILSAAAVVLIMGAPSAYARFNLTPSGPSLGAVPRIAAVAPAGARELGSQHAGFRWGDAGIGAAGAIALLAVGSLGVGVRRRRIHHQLTA